MSLQKKKKRAMLSRNSLITNLPEEMPLIRSIGFYSITTKSGNFAVYAINGGFVNSFLMLLLLRFLIIENEFISL